ncbi:large conductance mechanosensitive channel protein MscL [Peptoniphilus sp. KCTC 25270]|uniref:large conductance mechanosensitive channel protein MscL n=1 Tax=Peptoniphilus sp. KCTC 25270 TaxID=2897414 RepID=UPI001E303B7C|nr:large conductance mechanosensitive channel protein MscL [Peptoniphilus sp. KCTC 25270]MCD1147643.1 large conductance mechanosensitive channel protein MscL [Peptoniphilus sp. KCTC 25270]
MKSTMQEFKEFIAQGNVLDLAVGVIIGGAFGKIVTSLVNDIIMPVIGLAMGGVDFTGLFVALDGNDYPTLAAAQEAGAGVIAYGSFIQNIIDFLIIAFVIFMVVKQVAGLRSRFEKKEEAEEAATTKTCPFCKSEVDIAATRCPHCTSELAETV